MARIISDHEILGRELGLTESDMTAINRNAREHQFQKVKMLEEWKQTFSWKATYRILIAALLKCKKAEYAHEVCKLLTQSKFFGAVGTVSK